MTLWFAALLGIVQGLTEFLPVSSTAHLAIVPALLGRGDAGAAFTAVIQLGTLAAVLLYFARDLGRMVRGVFVERDGPDARLAGLIVLGTIPIGIAGVLLKKHIEGPLRSLWVIAGALAVVGAIMWIADRRAKHVRTVGELGWKDAALIGAAQMCALVPGVSRSGSTMSAALLLGMRRDDAARFSFLLGIPAIGAAGVFELKKAVHELGKDALPALGVATVVAAIVGYLSIAWLLRYLRTRTVVGFSAYRIGLAAILVALLLGHVL